MRTLTKKDNVSIAFGEWFDKANGNTYYDAEAWINDNHYQLPYTYGYNHGDRQAIDESLAQCGYRVRSNKRNPWPPYGRIHSTVFTKRYRELFRA